MFPARCNVVHVVCVFPAEEIRVRLLMFFSSEVLTLEEGREQERVQPPSKGFAERLLTGRVLFATAVWAGTTAAAVLVESTVLLPLTGEEPPEDLGGWEHTVVVTDTRLFCESALKLCMLGLDLVSWRTSGTAAGLLEEVPETHATVFLDDLGLSCALLFSEAF